MYCCYSVLLKNKNNLIFQWSNMEVCQYMYVCHVYVRVCVRTTLDAGLLSSK